MLLVFIFGFFIGKLQLKVKPVSNTEIIIETIDKNFYGNVKTKKEYEIIAAKAVLASLNDNYSHIADKNRFLDDINENLITIGIDIDIKENDSFNIIHVDEGSSADKKGIILFDKIIKINGKKSKDLTFKAAYKEFIGKENETVNIEIFRPSTNEIKKFTLLKTKIKRKVVDYTILNKNIGYIDVIKFTPDTYEDVKKALKYFEDKNIKHLIIDLRNNPGGVVETTSDTLGLFLENSLEKTFNFINERKKSNIFLKKKKDQKQLFNGNIIVLVNKNTGSSSEFFADAIRYYSKATIIGEKTFGKLIIQNIFNLDENLVFTLTTMEYKSPKDGLLNKIGIKPDINISMDPLLKKFDKNDIKNSNVKIFLKQKYGENINYKDIQMEFALNYFNKK